MAAAHLACDQKKAKTEGRTLVFLDESGFRLAPLPIYSWSPKGHPVKLRGKLRGPHLSVIGAMTWQGRLLLNVHRHGCHAKEVVLFLRHLLFRLRGKLLILWDRGPVHQGDELRAFLALDTTHRLVFEHFPRYAPEVDPQEYVWRQLKYDEIVNRTHFTVEQLAARLYEAAQRLRRRVGLIRNFLRHAGLDPLAMRAYPYSDVQVRVLNLEQTSIDWNGRCAGPSGGG